MSSSLWPLVNSIIEPIRINWQLHSYILDDKLWQIMKKDAFSFSAKNTFLSLHFHAIPALLCSTCLRWVFLSLRFFCLDWLCCIFELIWYFGALGFDDFVWENGDIEIFNFWILIFGFVFLDLSLCSCCSCSKHT